MLKLERRILRYMMYMILPSMFLSALVLLVYRLPPSPPAKISMGVTLLLAYSVLNLSISTNLPDTSTQFPLIGKV